MSFRRLRGGAVVVLCFFVVLSPFLLIFLIVILSSPEDHPEKPQDPYMTRFDRLEEKLNQILAAQAAQQPPSKPVSDDKLSMSRKNTSSAQARYEVDVRYTVREENTSSIGKRAVLHRPVITTVQSVAEPTIVYDDKTRKYRLTITEPVDGDVRSRTIECDAKPIVRRLSSDS
jgi:hypothetical protein